MAMRASAFETEEPWLRAHRKGLLGGRVGHQPFLRLKITIKITFQAFITKGYNQ